VQTIINIGTGKAFSLVQNQFIQQFKKRF